jgi:8-oxo-dGTP pyrophosphatase MutT (NUDIX family)
MAWETLATKRLFEHPHHLPIVEDRVRLPDGSELDWLRYGDERDGYPVLEAVTGICQRGDGRVLIGWQWCHGPGREVDEFPGGASDVGEPLEDAMRRELKEEVGVEARHLTGLGSYLWSNRRYPGVFHVFLATDLTFGEPRPEPGEDVRLEWWLPDDVDEGIRSGRLQNMSTLASWALFGARNRAV